MPRALYTRLAGQSAFKLKSSKMEICWFGIWLGISSAYLAVSFSRIFPPRKGWIGLVILPANFPWIYPGIVLRFCLGRNKSLCLGCTDEETKAAATSVALWDAAMPRSLHISNTQWKAPLFYFYLSIKKSTSQSYIFLRKVLSAWERRRGWWSFISEEIHISLVDISTLTAASVQILIISHLLLFS